MTRKEIGDALRAWLEEDASLAGSERGELLRTAIGIVDPCRNKCRDCKFFNGHKLEKKHDDGYLWIPAGTYRDSCDAYGKKTYARKHPVPSDIACKSFAKEDKSEHDI